MVTAPAPSTRDLIRAGTTRLAIAGCSNARAEAEWLLGRLAGVSPLELYATPQPLERTVPDRFRAHIEARAGGMPLQYLLGEAEFFGRPFTVRPGVFIPRPETEAVVEAALGVLRPMAAAAANPLRLLELGTGSGCIAVTLALELPACLVLAIELSWKAVCVARGNVLRHGSQAQVKVVQGRWLEAVRGMFDGVIANPPYIPSEQVNRLPLDVRQEPRESLDGGPDGLRDALHIIRRAADVLRPGGVLVMECGEDQVEPLAQAAATPAWVERTTPITDLAGRPRGVIITRAFSPHVG
jgi:release factor glutamine methyltransferase